MEERDRQCPPGLDRAEEDVDLAAALPLTDH